MTVMPTTIAGSYRVENNPRSDSRGWFLRAFCEVELAPVLLGRHIVQVNLSLTHAVGAVRGLHYQRSPHSEMKIIRCLRGRVWDVTVDIRRGSATFLQWHAECLSAERANMIIIPEGCAHGFQALDPDSELLYLHTAAYAPEFESGIRQDDPVLGITWPLPVADLSDRDANLPCLKPSFEGLIL